MSNEDARPPTVAPDPDAGAGTLAAPRVSARNVDPVADLSFDPRNPRLTRDEEDSGQEQLLQIMLRRFKIDELAESMVRSGYLGFDPLLTCHRDGGLVVREGNRRLAAIKLLLAPQLAPDRLRAKWTALSDRLNPETRATLQALPVQVYADCDDEDLRAYIGFRHVTGVLEWPALEKANYIAELVASGKSYAEIAERLGSFPRHMERHFVARQLVEQARRLEVPGYERLDSAFGVLLRGLQTEGIIEFLGIKYDGVARADLEPVDDAHTANLTELVRWLVGSAGSEKLLPESRQLTRLGNILQSEEALRYLRAAKDPSFERAWAKSGGEVASLQDNLWAASDRLEESVALVPLYPDDERVREALARCDAFLRQMLQSVTRDRPPADGDEKQ